MAIALGVIGTVATGTTTLTVTIPATATVGDMMVMLVGSTASTSVTTYASNANWTQLATAADTGSPPTPSVTCLWRKCQSGDPSATVDMTFTNTPATAIGVIHTYSGVDANTPFEASSAIIEAGAGSTGHATDTITTARSTDWIIGAFVDRSSASWTPPGSYSERSDTNPGGTNPACMETVDSNATVASGSISITATGTASTGTAVMFIGALQMPIPLNRPTIFGTVM